MVGHITGRITGLKDEISGLTTRAAQIESRRDLLKHELDKGSAVVLQTHLGANEQEMRQEEE